MRHVPRETAHDLSSRPAASVVHHAGPPRATATDPRPERHEQAWTMTETPRRTWNLVPFIGQLRSYDRAWLRGDLIAGVTVAALIVPKNLGYAGIAGIPLQNGLYAAAAGAILYAVFGTSRQISTGPSSGLAAVAGSAVAVASISGE